MKTFSYCKEELVQVWHEVKFEVEAESASAADKLVRENIEGPLSVDSLGTQKSDEYLFETEEVVSPRNNEGKPTIRIRNTDTGRIVASNGTNGALKYFEKCRELKMEMVTKISSVLGDREVSLEEEDFNVIVTERHCGETYPVKISSISSYGFIADGSSYTLSEMSMMDLSFILDYLISGEW